MRLFSSLGPNPKRVRVYLAEKGLALPVEHVDIFAGENRTPEFLARNPLGRLPVLELDDGTFLPESLAIIEYLEELHPEPPMIGRTPAERARVRALERAAEMGILHRVGTLYIHGPGPHSASAVALGARPSPEACDYARRYFEATLAHLDAAIGDRPFVAGDRPTIADCTLFAALEIARLLGVDPGARVPAVERWYAGFARRPSAAA
jgi:glutathione S-transferase